MPGCVAIRLYISGCVTIGSSASLWPSRRKQTRSMNTSLWNACRNSIASSIASRQTSGSSALTWKIGASTIFAMSVQYSVPRVSRGSDVVKPIWLLMTMWIVPPV